MPEVDPAKGRARPNPYAKRIATQGITLQVGRGRPKRGAETGSTIPKSIRLPAQVWERLAKRARKEGLPLHAALRAAVLAWLDRAA
jgi:macrodomain Ter protein organizer (MatP/YcbG family)